MATPIVTALAVYEVGKKAYEAYQGIVAFVSLGSSADVQSADVQPGDVQSG
ncbi:hypothetical protein [Streptomyces sp. 6N106]|uniref:hypothetical protein n=1 Tax=Streptomyces sp. 6N106 TaxID=3457418 RepID=UPI003FD4541F